jgi:cobalamin biosynthesis protein CobT
VNCATAQKRAILKNITIQQKKIIQEIAVNILKGIIPLPKRTFETLTYHKNSVRKLAGKQISRDTLSKNYFVVNELVKLALHHHEICEQISVSSNRRVGSAKKDTNSNKRKKKTKTNKSRKTRNSDTVSSSDSSSGEEQSESENSEQPCSKTKNDDEQSTSEEEEEQYDKNSNTEHDGFSPKTSER